MTEADSLGFEHNLETVVVFISPEHGNYAGTKRNSSSQFQNRTNGCPGTTITWPSLLLGEIPSGHITVNVGYSYS